MSRSIHVNARAVVFLVCIAVGAASGRQLSDATPADRQLSEYFRSETAKLEDRCLSDVKTLDDWKPRRGLYRQQLLEMLGLDPFPAKTPLKAVVTGTVEAEQFIVEKLHFQSMPGLYVTASLCIPKNLDKPVPAILYVCGHGRVVKDGISYGNKAAYQHHGEWFARHGYVCLTIDTVQLGEIEGIHHGTYRYDMWWWNSRGYTSAGVEAWNCVRALDYLETRKEVDSDRIGVTGRSGGGAYSWWISAIDERIKAAVPVAGITDLQNHIVDGCVEGHCDCMYIVNTYRWDYPMVAALVAPRPLLISNSDKDTIFPLEGVFRVQRKVRQIYRLYGKEENFGLHITEGPHKDTQELRVHAFTWFNRFLKGESPVIEEPAVRFFEPEQLKVFKELPADEINTKIHETFVPKASPPAVPKSDAEWASMRDGWMQALREKVFRGWPTKGEAGSLDIQEAFSAEAARVRLTEFDFTSQPHVRLRLFMVSSVGVDSPERVVLNVLDAKDWTAWLARMRVAFGDQLGEYRLPDVDVASFRSFRNALAKDSAVYAYIAPRGVGPTAWSGDERKQTQICRRFMLLGQTLDGMRVWDVRRAVQALGRIDSTRDLPITLAGHDTMAGIALYASLFESGIASLELTALPESHRSGPTFLNVLRFLDTPQAVALAVERTNVALCGRNTSVRQFAESVAENLGWDRQRLRVESW